MTYNYNQVTLLGRLTKNPEIKDVAKSKKVSFTIAIDRPYKKEDGTTDTDFISIISWGKLAEIVEKYCKKGQAVLVDGRIQVRSYEKKEEKRWITEVVAQGVQILTNGKEEYESRA